MAHHLLLLGAGFSRNWGGWLANEIFDYLLGCDQIIQSERLKEVLWENKSGGGFENALAEIQKQDTEQKSDLTQKDVWAFQDAISQMFSDLNTSLGASHLEFQNFAEQSVKTFLVKFDAIFTLNQDLLLEHHYLNENVCLVSSRRWNDWQIPGMRLLPATGPQILKNRCLGQWCPTASEEFKVHKRNQPYFKLHGSSNWLDSAGKRLLIIGGNKSYSIESHSILSWYYRELRENLSLPDTRLMIIGYSFGDTHINHAITEAAGLGNLQIFVIDPHGTDILDGVQECDLLRQCVIGASTRTLRETFGSDQVEHSKVMRFFL